jgi:hypothetical protein
VLPAFEASDILSFRICSMNPDRVSALFQTIAGLKGKSLPVVGKLTFSPYMGLGRDEAEAANNHLPFENRSGCPLGVEPRWASFAGRLALWVAFSENWVST